jgi:membrane-bound ClpP family serine protease
MAASELREDAREVLETISHHWLAALTVVLGAFYIFLGATALGVAGMLGIGGGITILAIVALSSRMPTRVASLVLVAAALPFAVLTWWSIVTPLLAILVVVIGSFALRRSTSFARDTRAS